MQSQRQYPQKISLEFFPPRTDRGVEKLQSTIEQLDVIHPEYMSVTYGAGGTTQARTMETVEYIQTRTNHAAAPHITCIGASRESVSELLAQYKAMGIKRLVALRGDLPSGMMDPGEFKYASDLVAFIRETTGDDFTIEVAAYPEFHPQAESAETDLLHFKHKIEAGSNAASPHSKKKKCSPPEATSR